MAFAPAPLVPGDAFDAALRFGREVDVDLQRHSEPADRAAALARHWHALTGLGWTGTLLPEEAGGLGGGVADLAALADGAGRSGLPLPLAAGCGAAPMLLRMLGDAATQTAAAGGALRACPVLDGAIRAEEEEGGWTLEGEAIGCEAVPEATDYLVACPAGPSETGLFLLPAAVPGLGTVRHLRIDGRLSVDLALGRCPARLLARGGAAREATAAARDLGAFLTCVEAVSAMGALIERTIAHLSTRVQFGAALSSFQALRHRTAEMYVAYETSRGLLAGVLGAAADAPAPPWRDVALAKLRVGEAGRFVAESAIQLHGGMGMTESLPASRLARRILQTEFEFGDRFAQAQKLLGAA